MSFSLSLHGGRCCGVKHLYGFNNPPNTALGAMNVAPAQCQNIHDDHCYPGENFYPGPAPQEKAIERLDRILEFLDEKRPNGILQVVLIAHQKLWWHKELVKRKRGFKLVSECHNSNSGNRLYVYHRCTDLKKPKKKSTVSLRTPSWEN